MTEHNSEHVVAETKYMRLLSRSGWYYVSRRNVSGIVVIAAVTADSELVLVEQYRPPLDASVIELPAGLVGDDPGEEGESLLSAARRELLEEAGFVAQEMECVIEGPPSPGITDEVLTFVCARDARRIAAGGGDATEDIRVHVVPLSDVHSWLAAQREQGKAVDVKIYAGLYLVTRLQRSEG
jgi:ADP-ribose pyrophosphatase